MLETFIVIQVGIIVCILISRQDVLGHLKEASNELKLSLVSLLSMTWLTIWIGAI